MRDVFVGLLSLEASLWSATQFPLEVSVLILASAAAFILIEAYGKGDVFLSEA